MRNLRTLVNGESIRDETDHRFWSDGHQMRGGDMAFVGGCVVFCKIDQVLWFFEQLRLTRKRIILVTGEGDLPCNEFRQRFLPANIVHWFATNVTHPDPRVTALPLGFGAKSDSVTLSNDEILIARETKGPREKWLYVNFRPQTNPSIRQPIFDYFTRLSARESWVTIEKSGLPVRNEEFIHKLMTHRFVICPPGNGVDTHRMWESLAAGAIPVVKRSQAMEPFRELPILFVDRYEEVTFELLEDAADRISHVTTENPMLQAEYWTGQIRAAKLALKGRELMPRKDWIMESFKHGGGIIRRKLFN